MNAQIFVPWKPNEYQEKEKERERMDLVPEDSLERIPTVRGDHKNHDD